jgi:catechol 2,3-dioxygenase-like lactoylglutathione lyase family enzyme
MSEARLVTGVDFVTVPAQDLEQSVRFYGDTLGLKRAAYIPERGYAEFETRTLTLSVIVPEKMGTEHFTSRGPIALHVDDRRRRRVSGRAVRHGRVLHVVLHRPERQRADAPSPPRAAHDAALSGA